MSFPHSSQNRRHVLGLGLSLGLGAAMSPLSSALAADSPLTFQLSWIKSIQYGGYFAGLENGFFSRNNIQVAFNSGGPNIDPVGNVATGRAQLGDRPIGPLIVARERGMPIKVIATVFQRSPFSIMSLASKPIRSIKDLKGKTVAVSTSSKPLMINLIREAGLNPESVNIIPSAPDPSALVSGQIDAYTGYSTNQGVMLETRGVKIFSLNAHDLGMPETAGTIYGREDFLNSNREQVVRFLKGAISGWEWALSNKEKTARLMVDKYGAPGLDFDAQHAEIIASDPFITAGPVKDVGLLALDMALYEKTISIYRKVGIVKSDMTAVALCDPSFINAALKTS